MKNSTLFASAMFAAACLTSACGKDSSKKEPVPAPATVYHLQENDGFCQEVVREQLLAKGYDVADETVPGSCPAQIVLTGSETVTRYASCPSIDEDGVPFTKVFYSKILVDGDLIDLTVSSPEKICADAAK